MRLASIGIVAIVARPGGCPPAIVRLATFNIEDFPRDDRQVRGAFAEIRRLDVPVIALQEITRPSVLADAARRELGPEWRTFATDGPDNHRLGLLWDTSRVDLQSVRTRDETRVIPGAKPILEARVRTGGREVRLLVVHLKAGGIEQAAIRARQLAELGRVVDEDREHTVVLGDFNATTDVDRVAIRALSTRTGLHWATEWLACTSYWNRSDGCVGSALDHALTPGAARVSAGGGCAETGCWPNGQCPIWHREVSDHCPVVVDR